MSLSSLTLVGSVARALPMYYDVHVRTHVCTHAREHRPVCLPAPRHTCRNLRAHGSRDRLSRCRRHRSMRCKVHDGTKTADATRSESVHGDTQSRVSFEIARYERSRMIDDDGIVATKRDITSGSRRRREKGKKSPREPGINSSVHMRSYNVASDYTRRLQGRTILFPDSWNLYPRNVVLV